MISGIDYMFISNVDGKYVNECFRDFFVKLWANPIFDDSLMCSKEDKTELYELFIAKNNAMLEFHDENGFELDENGERVHLFNIFKISKNKQRFTQYC
jgi:hypothetical protein